MGSGPRPKPHYLAEKLLQIRQALGLSQNELLERLGLADELVRSNISKYELGTGEPPLPVLLLYARVANVYLEVLVDDELELPLRLPCREKSLGRKRKQVN